MNEEIRQHLDSDLDTPSPIPPVEKLRMTESPSVVLAKGTPGSAYCVHRDGTAGHGCIEFTPNPGYTFADEE